MILFLIAVLLASVPTNEDLGLPPGVRGECRTRLYGADSALLHESEANRFVSHDNWARDEEFARGPQGKAKPTMVTVITADGYVSYTDRDVGRPPRGSVRKGWADPPMGSIARSASPIEHLRALRIMKERGVPIKVETRDGYTVYTYTRSYNAPAARDIHISLWVDEANKELRRAETRLDNNPDAVGVYEFLDWQPIAGTPWRHPRTVELHTRSPSDGSPWLLRAEVFSLEALSQDEPPQEMVWPANVRIWDYDDMVIRDRDGNQIGRINKDYREVVEGAIRMPTLPAGPIARFLTNPSTWLVAGGTAFVVLGAVAYRFARKPAA